ncbi:histidine ABC transporter permease HisM [Pseudomonas corrugata]|uniref:histidine ABC transporter permease HisM n=1 Tax=Pseudomonas corrugata TaxID=47879 RepID=UPI0015866343|nr:histidine ABC transporter permease HisM [Pseudomonas corrugata]NUT64662.1 histidine ABC transporter permease HisM [Pseudomonas corrugata]
MIDILRNYGLNFLWSDGVNFSGLVITLWLLIVSLIVAFLISLPLAVMRFSRNPLYAWPVWLFTYVFRGTPLYLQLLIIYAGVYQLQFVREHAFLQVFFQDALKCTILALALNSAAYTTEMLAATMRTISHGEIEAAKACGLTRFAIYRKLIIPATLRRALPAYSNEVILVLHSTAIAFTVTVPDVLKVAGDVNAETYQSFEAYGIASLIYLSVSFVLIGVFRQVERRALAFMKR